MTDPNDTFEDDLKTIQYNKAIDALIKVVKEDYCFFESFLMDEYPDYLNNCSEHQLRRMHGWFKIGDDGEHGAEIFKKWLEYVEAESERRVIG